VENPVEKPVEMWKTIFPQPYRGLWRTLKSALFHRAVENF